MSDLFALTIRIAIAAWCAAAVCWMVGLSPWLTLFVLVFVVAFVHTSVTHR